MIFVGVEPTSQVLVVLFVVAFCYDFQLCRDYDYLTYYDHFLKDSLTVGVFATVAKRHVFFPREVTGHHR